MNPFGRLLLLGVGVSLSNCEKPLQYEPAAMLGVSFAGIPESDVTLDAVNRIISVELPPVLDKGLRPAFRLTRNTQVWDGLTKDNTVDLTPYCACNESAGPRESTIRVANDRSVTAYQLRVKTKGSLKGLPSRDQILFSRQSERLILTLPVENLYGNPRVTDFEFTNLETGQVIRLNTDGTCVTQCRADRLNQLVIDLVYPRHIDPDFELTPGTYSIRLGSLPNLVSFSQRVVVTE